MKNLVFVIAFGIALISLKEYSETRAGNMAFVALLMCGAMVANLFINWDNSEPEPETE